MGAPHPILSAFCGFLLILPFTVLNFIVANRVEPFYSWLGSFGFLTSSPWLPTLLLTLFPIAFFITIRPMLHTDAVGRHHLYLLNSLFGMCILIATIGLWFGLGEDIIACDVLKIPNCD